MPHTSSQAPSSSLPEQADSSAALPLQPRFRIGPAERPPPLSTATPAPAAAADKHTVSERSAVPRGRSRSGGRAAYAIARASGASASAVSHTGIPARSASHQRPARSISVRRRRRSLSSTGSERSKQLEGLFSARSRRTSATNAPRASRGGLRARSVGRSAGGASQAGAASAAQAGNRATQGHTALPVADATGTVSGARSGGEHATAPHGGARARLRLQLCNTGEAPRSITVRLQQDAESDAAERSRCTQRNAVPPSGHGAQPHVQRARSPNFVRSSEDADAGDATVRWSDSLHVQVHDGRACKVRDGAI